jgi:hypothetical protein
MGGFAVSITLSLDNLVEKEDKVFVDLARQLGKQSRRENSAFRQAYLQQSFSCHHRSALCRLVK